jgi:hypothetical protein
MQPTLNPAFTPWDCWRTGDGILRGHLSGAWTNRDFDLVATAGRCTPRGPRSGSSSGTATRTGSPCESFPRRIRETEPPADGSGRP